MKERRDIVALSGQAGGGVLVTLVRVHGSSYRRPGARLLILPDGRTAGTISGGCLEAEILRKALWKVRDGAVIERFSTAFDDTAEIPYGLGCGGIVDLLLEPVDSEACKALLGAMAAALHGYPCEVVTWLPRPGGAGLKRLIRSARGEELFADTNFSGCDEADPEHCFEETLAAPQRLVVLGAGEDARPVVRMANELGWSVMVADGRPQLAKRERFPGAEAVEVAETLADVKVSRNDAVILMTHSYEQDRHWLTELLPLAPKYLGLLGARHRSSLLIEEAAQRAGLTLQQACDRVHAPIGLDLGGDGPEAVALAILAEVQAVLHERPAGLRQLTAEKVRTIIDEGPAVRYEDVVCALDVQP
ncbi:XdhC family protein [Terriglobus albidus]|uniref:XdhC family protein n=1 Tax=Terriglobus albidus TaxID=1592106 RepID=UPI0021DFC9AA|nr:XdhC/CoxI family protein [Terriglobus albidus]